MIFICYDCGAETEKPGQNGRGDCDKCGGRSCVILKESE
jgi:DNA-directed RNA polymerase subunit RPC12/RpoP